MWKEPSSPGPTLGLSLKLAQKPLTAGTESKKNNPEYVPCPPVLLVARQAVSRQMRTRKTTQVQPAPQTAGDAKEQEIRDA